ncbi:MAG: LysR family transcriptional regulator [Acidobacteriia bacterium]|nr:LysR family transcriptional regulator [Terriglobia bacterium]
MIMRGRYRIPPANALLAFESAARHGNFTLAARELGTSQSAVSRDISRLETWLSARLFERSRAGATLTDAGKRFHDAVLSGLAAIRHGAAEASELASGEQVVIACSHEAAHSLVMLRYGTLQRALGENVRIRILTYHDHLKNLPAEPVADILLTWDAAAAAPEDRVAAVKEEVRPVCSPAYAATHERTLAGPVAGWSELVFLDLLRPNEGWATWEDWFAAAGHPAGTPRRLGLDSYAYVLEAAAADTGIALGWRHFIEPLLEAGTLVALGQGYVEFDRAYYGVLTAKGRRKPLAQRCLDLFGRVD